eukprot:scaffold41335_cov221-Amphora_coffeaeformis.AAC.1
MMWLKKELSLLLPLALARATQAPDQLRTNPSFGELTWNEQQELLASDGSEEDAFGFSVAIDQDTIIIGSPFDTENDFEHGSAYVFIRSNSSWTPSQKLIARDVADGSWFGEAVAVQGDTAIIGALFDDNSGSFGNGGVYIFGRQTDGVWVEVQKLVVANSEVNDHFGEHVAIDGQTIVIGESNGNDDKGATYVYVKTGYSWTLETKLLHSEGAYRDQFGRSVDISKDTVVVGAPGYFLNPNIAGYAVVFQRTGNVWDSGFELRPDDGSVGDEFGQSVAVDGNTIVVGNGLKGDGEASYVFQRREAGKGWTQVQKLDASGLVVAISGDVIISGESAFGRLPDGTWRKHAGELATASNPYPYLTSVAVSGYTAITGTPYNGNGSAGVFVALTADGLVPTLVTDSTPEPTRDFIQSDGRTCDVGGLGDFDPAGQCANSRGALESCALTQISDSQCTGCRSCVVNFLDTFVSVSGSCSENEATICWELNKCDDECGVCSDELEDYFKCLWMN